MKALFIKPLVNDPKGWLVDLNPTRYGDPSAVHVT